MKLPTNTCVQDSLTVSENNHAEGMLRLFWEPGFACVDSGVVGRTSLWEV